jgi:hypothetical protein
MLPRIRVLSQMIPSRGSLGVSFFIVTILLSFTMVNARLAAASLSINDPIVVYSIDFSGFSGLGFVPEPTSGQLDSDTWRISGMSDGDLSFGGSATSGDYAMGSSAGGVGPAGIYAFQVSPGVVALGVQPANSDFTPGEIVLRIQNNTGERLSGLQVGYDLWVNNDASYSTVWEFLHSADDANYIPAGDAFASDESADALGWQLHSFSVELIDLALDHGGYYYLKWMSDDASGHGQRDEFGLNKISVSATVEVVNYPPQAVDDQAITTQDEPVSIDVRVNDSDIDGDPLYLADFGQPAHGVVTRDEMGTLGDSSDDRLVYTPSSGWSGEDNFTYTVDDGFGGQDMAVVDVLIEASFPYAVYLPLIQR